jgi:hypothetical protein
MLRKVPAGFIWKECPHRKTYGLKKITGYENLGYKKVMGNGHL